MKKLILLLAMAIFALSCDDSTEKPQQVWDANKMILIKPDQSAFKMQTKANEETSEHLTALEIVKQGDYLEFIVTYEDEKLEKPYSGRRGFSEKQKDFTTPALKMWGTDIIDQDGKFVKHFIYGYDMVVCTAKTGDTIAYIPNKILEDCREPLEKAYNEGRYEDVYEMFDNTFKFRPITGAEWRELKKQGKQ